jgi:hypothetical protein
MNARRVAWMSKLFAAVGASLARRKPPLRRNNVLYALCTACAAACGGKILLEPSIEIHPLPEAGVDSGDGGSQEALPDAVAIDRPSVDGPLMDRPSDDGPIEDRIVDVRQETAQDCQPGQVRCSSKDRNAVERCSALGRWEDPVRCADPTPICQQGQCTFLVPDGLVAFYPLDGDGHDATSSGHDGQLHGSVVWDADRHNHAGRAAAFDGQSYISAVHPLLPVNVAPRTLAAWVRCALPPRPDWQLAAAWGSSALHAAEFGIGRENAHAAFTGHYADLEDTGDTVVDGDWHFLVVTFDATIVTLILDDRVMQSRDIKLLTQGTTLTIGRDNLDDAPNAWRGIVDEVRVYNRVLAAAEIHTLYTDGAP